VLRGGRLEIGVFMRNKFVLCAVATATIAAVLPASTALAQPQAMTREASAPAASRSLSLSPVHLVTGLVLDAAGHAVSGACVLAVGATGQVKMARTGTDGRYELALPQAGDYSLRYRDCQPGKAATTAPPDRPIVIGASPMTSLPATVLARPATTSLQAALATAGIVVPSHLRVTLAQPGQAIENGQARRPAAGTPLAVITGKVTSPSGRSLAGICMSIIGNGFAIGTETGKHGTYRLEIGGPGFPAGKFPVEFDSSCTDSDPFGPIAPGRWAPEWYKDKFSPAKADKVRLRIGKTVRGINAVMQPAGQVAGVVRGSDGRRIRNACAVLTTAHGQEVGQAETSRTGSYRITGLDPGSDRLAVFPACTGRPSDYGVAWYPRAATIGKARAVAVSLGHLTGGIDVVLPKLGTISGQIRLGGRSGRPLSGMCVGVFSPANPFTGGGFASSGRDGRYVVEGLAPGRYQVEANPGCNNNGNYTTGSYRGTLRVRDGRTISGVNIYLQPGGVLSGQVTAAATGKPLAGICVSDENGDGVVTGSSGTYRLDQLPAERTTVQFAGCQNRGSYAPQYYHGQVAEEAARTVIVRTGHDTAGIDASMLPGATISGVVTGTNGQPARNVCVSAAPQDELGYPLGNFGADATTSAAGAYTVANLAPGLYGVVFSGGCDFANNVAAQQWFKGQPGSGTAGLISAPAGVPVAGVDAVVARGGSIQGTVTEPSGTPVAFACVTAISQATGAAGEAQAFAFNGQYTLPGLAAGKYTIEAASCQTGNLADATYRGLVTVRAGHTKTHVNLKLPVGGILTGKVTVAATGAAARGVCVAAEPVNTAARARGYGGFAGTGANGQYRMVGLNTGRYIISVLTTEYCGPGSQNLAGVTLHRPVEVRQGKVTSGVSASLRQGGSIAGRVTGTGNAVEPGACVEVFQRPGGLIEEDTASEYGTYVLSGLAAGKYKVELGDPYCSDGAAGLAGQWYKDAGGSGTATTVTVRAGKTTGAIDASLPADGTVSGSVTGPGSTALTGVCVSAVPVAKGLNPIDTVSSAGGYQLTDVPPGSYRIEFESGCGQSGLASQWWDAASSVQAATIIRVTAGDTVPDISATMAAG
jgi:hypothetical protein